MSQKEHLFLANCVRIVKYVVVYPVKSGFTQSLYLLATRIGTSLLTLRHQLISPDRSKSSSMSESMMMVNTFALWSGGQCLKSGKQVR
jgi:hypothetical protein